MLSVSKITDAQVFLQLALESYAINGNKRIAVGQLDHAKEDIIAAIHIIINEIKEEEGKF